MNRGQFDALARLVATKQSRRAALASTIGATLLGYEAVQDTAWAKRKGKNKTKSRKKKKRKNQVRPCYPGNGCLPGAGQDNAGCDFSNSNSFNGLNAQGSQLRDANFAGADLRDADLSGSNLAGACLAEADLAGSNLDGVKLKGAILCGTILPDGSVDDSGCDKGTRCCPTTEDAYATTVDYLQQFYPLWFTYYQSLIVTHNRLVGPDTITPVYQVVVAINDDTLYASTFLDLATQPDIVTIPATTVRYSVLTVDPYGTIVQGGIPDGVPGLFALTGPGFSGSLPSGVTRIDLPLDFMTLIFRADKYSASGDDQTAEAEQFRTTLQLQTLCDYEDVICPDGSQPDTSGGFTRILPVRDFAAPFKTVADGLISTNPIAFLKQLQTAVASSNTPPLSPAARKLSDRFNQLFGNGNFNSPAKEQAFATGAQDAHEEILDSYLSNLGPTNWIHFTNIGAWGDDVVDRAAITEFIQYGNGSDTAAYYHTFRDDRGRPLDGDNDRAYVLTFPAGQLPEAERFWSVTAYTPESIELIPNSADKYLVASYTPNLETNPDGSLSIYMATTRPAGVPEANWLPIHNRLFNIMLRVYGPEGSVANNTYVPPAIERLG